MTYEEIEKELENWEGDVYYISMMPEFVWSLTEKRVAGYHEYSTPQNLLQVYQTEVLDLNKETIVEYLTKTEITAQDVLVICINQDFYPKEKGKWLRFSIINKVNKKKYENRRDETGKLSNPNSKNSS